MARETIWHGTPDETLAFVAAVERYCRETGEGDHCQYSPEGKRSRTCAAHEMMLHDQRAADGLVFMRRKADCLKREEGLRCRK